LSVFLIAASLASAFQLLQYFNDSNYFYLGKNELCICFILWPFNIVAIFKFSDSIKTLFDNHNVCGFVTQLFGNLLIWQFYKCVM
jgi:hypothetical protein